MILIPVEGVRKAIPIGAPKVYTTDNGSVSGGMADHLVKQVCDTVTDFCLLPEANLSQFVGE